MNTEPEATTWADLVAREPALGDLLASVRSFRGTDAQAAAYFYGPGGVNQRLVELLASIGLHDPFPLLADVNDSARAVVWWALQNVPKGDAMTEPTWTNQSERSQWLAERSTDLAITFSKRAEAIRGGAVFVMPDGTPTPAAFYDELAALAARLCNPNLNTEGVLQASAEGLEKALAALGTPDAP